MKDPNYAEPWVDDLIVELDRNQLTNSSLPRPATKIPSPRDAEFNPEFAQWLAQRDKLERLRLANPNPADRVASSRNARPWDSEFATKAEVDSLAERLEVMGMKSGAMTKATVTRSSTNFAALRTLPKEANIVLLTPVVVPVGQASSYKSEPTTDPFEPLGRALSKHHGRIRHVPYVPQAGLTKMLERFLDEAAAIIAILCEPNDSGSDGIAPASVKKQMKFAVDALDAFAISSTGKLRNSSNAFVLVELGSEEFRPPAGEVFENVVESSFTGRDVGKHVAHAIFKG